MQIMHFKQEVTTMNMDLWVREQIATQDKKAMPLLSYPAV